MHYCYGDKKFTFMKDYKHDNKLRASFNALASLVYDFNFEDWYQSGYWRDETYIPYSLVLDGQVVANASINKMTFLYEGQKRKWLQIGTVMTHPEFRRQGLAKHLLEHIIKEYQEAYDLIFLYANTSAIDFYPQFGFEKSTENEVYMPLYKQKPKYTLKKVDTSDPKILKKLEYAIENAVPVGKLSGKDVGLVLFYCMYFSKKDVYYLKEEDAFIIAQKKGQTFYLQDVFCEKEIDVTTFMPKGIKQVRFGYTPNVEGEFAQRIYEENGVQMFTLGRDQHIFKENKLMVPYMLHT